MVFSGKTRIIYDYLRLLVQWLMPPNSKERWLACKWSPWLLRWIQVIHGSLSLGEKPKSSPKVLLEALRDLPVTSLLSPLSTPRLAHSAPATWDSLLFIEHIRVVLPEDLCTGRSLGWECSSPRYPPTWLLPCFLPAFTWRSPSQQAFPCLLI